MGRPGFGDPDQPMYVISIAAELAGVHPQTLRVYERKGLLAPKRTTGNSRRYSQRDIELLRRIQELTNDGLNLAGVVRVLELEQRAARVRRDLDRALQHIARLEGELSEALMAHDSGSLVPFRDVRRVRRAMKADLIDQAGKHKPFVAPPASGPDQEGNRK